MQSLYIITLTINWIEFTLTHLRYYTAHSNLFTKLLKYCTHTQFLQRTSTRQGKLYEKHVDIVMQYKIAY